MVERTFIKLTLGHALAAPEAAEGVHQAPSVHPVQEPPARKLLFRPVEIRGETLCAVVSRFANRDQTTNITFALALDLVESKLGSEFLSGHLFTQTEEAQLHLGEPGRKARLRVLPVKRPPATLAHDRAKSRHLDSHAPYLAALGVTDASGKVHMGDKFRQIERFLDLLASAFSDLRAAHPAPDAFPSITLCDMGSGKGYLTFAAYDFFQRIAQVPATVTGVEARPELVRLCNRVAQECGFERLKFLQSTIEEFPVPAATPASPTVLVALHACDTATDDALAAGIRSGASIILVAPCCQKEIRPQLDQAASSGPLRDVLRHGIFAERHAEIATDALRALLLERAGYRVRVCEFVAPEHTAKNIMLIASLRPGDQGHSREAGLDQRISELKSFYGVQHHRLQQLLVEGRHPGGAPQAAGPVS